MTDLEDEDEKMDPKTNARSIDSRLADPGTPSYRRTPAAPATFRVQGHVPARQRLTVTQILRMPKGQRPPPGSPCYRCRDLGKGDHMHWRDECPNQGPRPSGSRPQTNYQRQTPPFQPRQQAPRQFGNPNKFGGFQGNKRNTQRNGSRNQQPRQPQRFRRTNEASGSAVAEAHNVLQALPEEVRRGVLVSQAKALGL